MDGIILPGNCKLSGICGLSFRVSSLSAMSRSSSVEPKCIGEKTTTFGCPGVYCPKKAPTFTEQFPYVPICRTKR